MLSFLGSTFLASSNTEIPQNASSENIVVYLGPPGGITTRLVHAMRREVEEVMHVDVASEPSWDRPGHPAVWVKGRAAVHGWAPVCRYLGRLCHMHPSDPEHALIIDETLDDLAEFVAPFTQLDADDLRRKWIRSHMKPYLNRLAGTIDDETLCLYEFDAPTVADVCWRAAIHWILEWHLDHDEPRDTFKDMPLLRSWFEDEGREEDTEEC